MKKQQIENIKPEEDTNAFLQQITKLLQMTARNEGVEMSNVSNMLDMILKGSGRIRRIWAHRIRHDASYERTSDGVGDGETWNSRGISHNDVLIGTGCLHLDHLMNALECKAAVTNETQIHRRLNRPSHVHNRRSITLAHAHPSSKIAFCPIGPTAAADITWSTELKLCRASIGRASCMSRWLAQQKPPLPRSPKIYTVQLCRT